MTLMVDRGFDILESLAPIGVKLNIPPPPIYSWKKAVGPQRTRIASLRIHVERCMKRIKNYHIFDGVMPLSLMDVSNQMIFVPIFMVLCVFEPLT